MIEEIQYNNSLTINKKDIIKYLTNEEINLLNRLELKMLMSHINAEFNNLKNEEKLILKEEIIKRLNKILGLKNENLL